VRGGRSDYLLVRVAREELLERISSDNASFNPMLEMA